MLTRGFTVRRFGPRYDRAEVDAFVQRVVASAGRTAWPALTVADLRNVAFKTPLLSPGYDASEVDAFLAEAEQWMPDHRDTGQVVTGQVPAGPRRAAPTFTPVRLREGYNMVEVDAFVHRVMATVNGEPIDRPVTPREIRRVQFTPVRLSEGYDVTEVDAFLDEAENWLTTRW